MSISDKIKNTDKTDIIDFLVKTDSYTVVLAPGVFDLFHPGHLKYLQEAKRLGDILVVAVSDDAVVDKGINRPVFSIQHRAALLAELECVDYVIINNKPDCSQLIEDFKPNILVKGEELRDKTTAKLQREICAMEKIKGRVIFLPTQISSSSMLINDYLCNLPKDTCVYLQKLKSLYSFASIKETIDDLSDVEVTLIGEAIIDEYIYGEVLGKSSKNPALVMNLEKRQKFAGGSIAIANHLAQLCKSVRLVTYVGDGYGENELGFLQSKLAPNVRMEYFHKESSPTIKKVRYIDSYYKQRLFETYEINQTPLNKHDHNKLCSILGEGKYVFISDFGHGLLSPDTIAVINERYQHLYCNVQCNAGNYGYNLLKKYQDAAYASIDVNEFRLLAHNKYDPIPDLVEKMYKESWFPAYLSVTEGKAGATLYSPPVAETVPAMCNSAIDTIGCGDAYYAITSLLLLKHNCDLRLIPFLGNISAAIAANIIGNEKAVSKDQILKNVEILLK
jgi:rfaE bifunctional protein nucleotidyltransferase chain/domain